jgi:hypothetical protein
MHHDSSDFRVSIEPQVYRLRRDYDKCNLQMPPQPECRLLGIVIGHRNNGPTFPVTTARAKTTKSKSHGRVV